MTYSVEMDKKSLKGKSSEEAYQALESQHLHYDYHISNALSPEAFIEIKVTCSHVSLLLKSLILLSLEGQESSLNEAEFILKGIVNNQVELAQNILSESKQRNNGVKQ